MNSFDELKETVQESVIFDLYRALISLDIGIAIECIEEWGEEQGLEVKILKRKETNALVS